MAHLIIQYDGRPPWTVPVTDVVFLDRDYLTYPDGDLAISRRPTAPCLVHRDGDWWLDNAAKAHNAYVAVHPPGEPVRVVVPRLCSFRLGDGNAEVWVWHPKYQLRLTVSGSAHNALASPKNNTLRTQVGIPGADQRVRALWTKTPMHRLVLAAYYRPFFIRGLQQPAPENRTQTLRCLGDSAATRLDRALRETMDAIWGEQGHTDELPGYLITQELLTSADVDKVPHKMCAHPRR